FLYCQRASLSTQKIFSAKYSSLSSSSAYSSFFNSSYFSSKESDTYFKNIIPNATFLYSAASILPRNLSAACHNFSSNPIVAIYIPPLCYPLHKYSKYLDIMWGFWGFLYKKYFLYIM